MNVNAAVLTDVMMTQSTAPPKDSGKTATEASGQNFQQVMEQYTGSKQNVRNARKESQPAGTKKTPVTDSGAASAKASAGKTEVQKKSLSESQNTKNETLSEQTAPEEEKKPDEARLQAMMALAEPVVVQVIAPEVLMEAVGDGSMAIENVDGVLDGQSIDNQAAVTQPDGQEAAGMPAQDAVTEPGNQTFGQEMMAADGVQTENRNPADSIYQNMAANQNMAADTFKPETAEPVLTAEQLSAQESMAKPSIHETAETLSQKLAGETQSQNAVSDLLQSDVTNQSTATADVANQSASEMANQVSEQNSSVMTGAMARPEKTEDANQVTERNSQNGVNQDGIRNMPEGQTVDRTSAQTTTAAGQTELNYTAESQIHGQDTEVKASEQNPNTQPVSQDSKVETPDIQNTAVKPANHETTSKAAHADMALKTAEENQPVNSQQAASETQNQGMSDKSKEALQNAQQAVSESSMETAASQAAVVSDASSAAGQTGKTESADRSRQTTVNTIQPETAEKSAIQEPAMAKASGQSSTADDTESGFADMLKNQTAQTTATKTSSEEHTAPVKAQVSTLSEEQSSLEELKKNAEARGINLMDRVAEARITGGARIQAMNQPAAQNEASVVSQVKNGLEQGMKNQLKEFTIHLRPEGLGDVIVKMVSQDGKVTVNIGASNSETQKLINSQMTSLKEMLEPLHAEVGEVYHSSQESMSFTSYNQNMSENQRQQTGHYQGNPNYGGGYTEDEEILTEAEYITAQSRMARLYTYV